MRAFRVQSLSGSDSPDYDSQHGCWGLGKWGGSPAIFIPLRFLLILSPGILRPRHRQPFVSPLHLPVSRRSHGGAGLSL